MLYIEHDDDSLYKMRLERVGDFEVLASNDSEQGCKLASTKRPDVILMDLEMPDADCWEVVRRLKKDAQTDHIPIIGMSAYALDQRARESHYLWLRRVRCQADPVRASGRDDSTPRRAPEIAHPR